MSRGLIKNSNHSKFSLSLHSNHFSSSPPLSCIIFYLTMTVHPADHLIGHISSPHYIWGLKPPASFNHSPDPPPAVLVTSEQPSCRLPSSRLLPQHLTIESTSSRDGIAAAVSQAAAQPNPTSSTPHNWPKAAGNGVER